MTQEQIIAEVKKNIPSELYVGGRLDIYELAKRNGINVLNYIFEDDKFSGVIERKSKDSKEDWTIYLNNSDSVRRKRFTAAHELGHFFSHKYDGKSKSVSGSIFADSAIWTLPNKDETTDPEHLEADSEATAIALDILMPEGDVTALVKAGKTVEEMADYFFVSEGAMTVRLSKLGYKLLESV